MMAGYRSIKKNILKRPKLYILIIQQMFQEWKKNWIAFRKKIQRQVLFRKKHGFTEQQPGMLR